MFCAKVHVSVCLRLMFVCFFIACFHDTTHKRFISSSSWSHHNPKSFSLLTLFNFMAETEEFHHFNLCVHLDCREGEVSLSSSWRINVAGTDVCKVSSCLSGGMRVSSCRIEFVSGSVSLSLCVCYCHFILVFGMTTSCPVDRRPSKQLIKHVITSEH